MDNFIGYKGVNSQGLNFTVIDSIYRKEKKNGRMYYVVEFEKTKYRTTTRKHSIVNGKIRDKLNPSVCGIGYTGEVSGVRKVYYKEYVVWSRMINFCYNKKNKDYISYGGKGYTVEEHWHCFKNFLDEIHMIDGYDECKFKSGELQLDKDLKQIGITKKIYSLETCIFLTHDLHEEITKLLWRIGDV